MNKVFVIVGSFLIMTIVGSCATTFIAGLVLFTVWEWDLTWLLISLRVGMGLGGLAFLFYAFDPRGLRLAISEGRVKLLKEE